MASISAGKRDRSSPVTPEAERRLLELLEGQKMMVDMGALPEDPPTWYDPVKFKRGQDFVRKHFAGISLAHFISLLTLLISPGVLKTLIFTQKSETVMKSFKRYISTLVHITSWYFGDVWQKDHPSRRSIQMVRSMHDHAARITNHPEKKPLVNRAGIAECGQLFTEDRPMAEAIHRDVQPLSSCPYARNQTDDKSNYIYFSQYDMAETQFAFVGVVVLFPRKFGIMYYDDEDLRGFIHFWRCIGYLLGIHDVYNLCNDDDLDKIRNLSSLFIDQMIKPAFKSATAEYEHMARAVAKGACKYYPGVSYESLFAYYAYAVGMPASNFIRRMAFGPYINYLYLRLVFCIFCWIPGVIAIFSGITKFCIGLVVDRSKHCWPASWKPPQVEGLDKFWSLPPLEKVNRKTSSAQIL